MIVPLIYFYVYLDERWRCVFEIYLCFLCCYKLIVLRAVINSFLIILLVS